MRISTPASCTNRCIKSTRIKNEIITFVINFGTNNNKKKERFKGLPSPSTIKLEIFLHCIRSLLQQLIWWLLQKSSGATIDTYQQQHCNIYKLLQPLVDLYLTLKRNKKKNMKLLLLPKEVLLINKFVSLHCCYIRRCKSDS